ncbi:MAG: transcriptional coactivator p15/PC4 family protein [Candidatus Omnitrophica bacterium]|nr:transcriptional coactivator p15/PC4 family protein [Candidatus Omnitrophota bacterium]
MDVLIASFPKNKFEEVRVQVKEFKGYDLLDLRVYTALKDGEEKIPTGKGLSLNVSHFQELKRAVLEAERVLKENHLIDE